MTIDTKVGKASLVPRPLPVLLYTEKREGLGCDVIVTTSRVGGGRITRFQDDNGHRHTA